jgi:hypothetical protein
MDGLELLRAIWGAEISGAPDRDRRPAGRRAVLGRDPGAGYGLDLLGTIAKPVTSAKLKTLLDNYQPAAEPRARARAPSFGFAEVGLGLQKRQFEPFFQPKIELATGQVKGLEVFARWRHPEHGVLGPAAFIDALEQNNRVDFLDWTMIETVGRALPPLPGPGPADLDLAEPGARDAGASAFLRQVTPAWGATACCPTISPSR